MTLPEMRSTVRRAQSGADLMPRFVTTTGAMAAIAITVETESLAAVLTCLGLLGTAASQETLIINYYDSSGARKVTCKYAKCIGVGPSTLPPAEENSRDAPRWQISFELEQGSGVTKVTEAIVEASGHATIT